MSQPADDSARRVDSCPSEDEVLSFAAGRLSPERRQEAHRHFDGCEVCQELLNEAVHALALAPTARSGSDEVAWGTQFRPGTVVGQRYVIQKFVARGGMGEVYEAFDRELQERVALKTVTATACDSPSAVRRLKAEVQLARRVSHPNVCRIYDFGTHLVSEAGPPTCFLTMEFVEGETLGKRVRSGGALPLSQACAIARKLLLGLRAAHEAGVLHRDFKSDNVMLRGDGRQEPLILDFGLARALDRDGEQLSSTHHGVVGTFAYIAPEQLDGEPHSTASDIYSFGVVWFEMLTGELPFKSTSSPARSTLVRLTRGAPPPSRKNPLIDGELDELVLGCLQRSPSDRFQTPAEVLARLNELESRGRGRRGWRRLWPLSLAAGLTAGTAYLAIENEKPATDDVTVRSAAARTAPSPTISSRGTVSASPQAVARHESQAAPLASAHPVPPPKSPPPRRAKAPVESPSVTPAAAPPASAATPPAPSTPLAAPPGWEDPFAKPGL